MGSFISVRTRLDINKLLCRGSLTVTGSEEPSKVFFFFFFFRYERLMDYCYTCGHLGHAVRDCEAIQDDDIGQGEDDHNYGPWLQASPLKKPTSALDGKRNPKVQKKLVFKPVTEPSSDNGRT